MTVYIVSHFQAEACRSVAQAIKKCPNGMYAEIKYDGERVQVHKQGDRFEFFSRSLKPVQPHKACVCVCEMYMYYLAGTYYGKLNNPQRD